MFYEPKDGHGLPRNPFNACVVPRPIAWISTLSEDGVANLAPFSHSNLVSITPPMVMFSCSGRPKDGDIKDSALNAELTGEFVYNMVTWDNREAMNLSSGHVERSGDEFEIAGLTKAPSVLIKPSRVAEAPINLECRTWKVIELPSAGDGSRTRMVIGEVVGVHIADHALTDGYVDTARLKPVSRLGYMDYAVVDKSFTITRPDSKIGGRA
ncbi:MAG: flavin reductase family protein [Gammaproteobacteria bacterium]|nr:flavin reductase family protein [Gammaproteobacteria bacterium]